MMRMMIVTVCVLIVGVTSIHANGQSGSLPLVKKPTECNIPEKTPEAASSCYIKNHGTMILSLMKSHFQNSMNYLLTSKQYGSQYVQRPGMSKLLSEASDRHWEEGMDLLKKFLQRGGSIAGTEPNFKQEFDFEGEAQLTLPDENMSTRYVDYLQKMLDDSKDLAKSMTRLYHQGGKSFNNGGDAEFAHYFSDKIEQEVDVIRKLAGHINTLDKMKLLGVAFSEFDNNL